jgi:hypothetical protein
VPEPSLPTYREFLLPTLRVLEDNAGSLSKREVDAAVIELLGITDEQLSAAYPTDATARGSKILRAREDHRC